MKDDVLRPIAQHQWTDETRPTVSVVVPAYNQERFIGQCLTCILMQRTDFPVEVIVHDDASTDGTAAIIQQFARKFPRIVRPILQTENQFAQHRKVRPILLGATRGEFVASCDGDDYWTDADQLVKQVACLRRHPDAVLCFHDAARVDESGRTVLSKSTLPPHSQRDYTRDELRVLQWGFILTGTMMHRNVKPEFPPEYHLVPNGDNFLPMLLAAYGGARFLRGVGPLAYRQHPGGIWSKKTLEERLQMELQTSLLITSYFVRIGEKQTALRLAGGRLKQVYARYVTG